MVHEYPALQARQVFAAVPQLVADWLAYGTQVVPAQQPPAQLAEVQVGGGVTHCPAWQVLPAVQVSFIAT